MSQIPGFFPRLKHKGLTEKLLLNLNDCEFNNNSINKYLNNFV